LVLGNCSAYTSDGDDDDDDDDDDSGEDDDDDKIPGCLQRDPVYGVFTLFFIFLPGLNISPLIFSNLTQNNSYLLNFLKQILVCIICVISFPIMFIGIKICCLFNHSQKMKILASQFVFSKGLLQSSVQMCFQVFIMITRSDRVPSWIQILAVIVSVIALTKINTENYLSSCQDINYMFGKSFKQKLQLLFKFGPLFFLTTLFRCGSLALTFSLLGIHSLWLLLCVTSLFIGIESIIFKKSVDKFDILSFLQYVFTSTPSKKSVIKGLPSHLFTISTNGNHMFHMTFFLLLHITLLCLLTILANVRVSLPHASHHLLLLNTLVSVLVVSGLVSYALYIHQVVNRTKTPSRTRETQV